MAKRMNHSGFSLIEVIIILAVVGALTFVGYNLYNQQNDDSPGNSAAVTQPATASDVPVAPEITSTGDLDKALVILDQTDTSSDSDSTQLDDQLQTF